MGQLVYNRTHLIMQSIGKLDPILNKKGKLQLQLSSSLYQLKKEYELFL